MPATDAPAAAAPAASVEAEFFALVGARDNVRVSLATLKSEGTKTSAAALTRALAIEAARATAPDRFVQALRQLETLEDQHAARIQALKEFARRFEELVRATRAQRPAEIEAALTARIQQLEEQRKQPGANAGEIEAEMARWKKELAEGKSAPANRKRPKSRRPDKA